MSTCEHVRWEAGQIRREQLTWHRRARRVEGTCATSEQRARSALSATLAARRYGQGSLHTRCEQGGVGSDPAPGLTIQRARACGLDAHMLARAAPKVGLTHGGGGTRRESLAQATLAAGRAIFNQSFRLEQEPKDHTLIKRPGQQPRSQRNASNIYGRRVP